MITLATVFSEAGGCPHRSVVPRPRLDDGTVLGFCEECGEDGFVIWEPHSYDEEPGPPPPLLDAALSDIERAMEHWPRLKPLYGDEQTEATAALSEIGACIGDALQRLRQLHAKFNGEPS